MHEHFTNLLLHHYNELNASEKKVFEYELISNPELQTEYQNLLECLQTLNKFSAQPSQKSLNKIMAYADSVSGAEIF